MYPNQNQRGRFTEDGLSTASGPKIVLMCFDRLDRDIGEALGALETKDFGRANEAFCHAQDIVNELLYMLDLGAWEHAASLAAVYRYTVQLLTRANVSKRPDDAIDARLLLAEIGDAFRQASIGLSVKTEHASPAAQFSARA